MGEAVRARWLIQFGTWNLHGFTEQRFELVQNGNGLSVNAVQMERGHANGRLIFKRADEHGRTQESFDFVCELVDCLGAELIESATNIGPVERNRRPLPREQSMRQAALSASTRSPASNPKRALTSAISSTLMAIKPTSRATRRISPMALTRA